MIDIETVLGSEKWHQERVDNLMRVVREWVVEKGGATGELHLKKSYSLEHRRWTVELILVHPTSTWMLGS